MTQYQLDYTTPDSLADYLRKVNPNASPSSTNQAQYEEFFADALRVIPQASQIIDSFTNNQFAPYIATKTYYIEDILRYSTFWRYTLDLGDYLQSVTGITWVGDSIASADYNLLPPNESSKSHIRFNSTAITASYGNFGDNATVSGIWCDHRDYTNAWTAQTTIQGNITSATDTTVNVQSVTGLEVLQYIRVNDEFMQITSVDAPDTQIIVERGVNGSTATTHTSGDSLDVFHVMPDIEMCANRIAGFLYQQRGSAGERIQFADGQQIVSELPPIVQQTLMQYRKPIYTVV